MCNALIADGAVSNDCSAAGFFFIFCQWTDHATTFNSAPCTQTYSHTSHTRLVECVESQFMYSIYIYLLINVFFLFYFNFIHIYLACNNKDMMRSFINEICKI